MKLTWKGKYVNEKQLTVGTLPDNAVKFREPETPAKLSLAASIFAIPVIILIGIAIFIKSLLYGSFDSFVILNVLGLLLSFLTVIPHEFLHAIAFPKQAEVEVWYSLKNMMAFVFTTCPVSKGRFIFVSLLPNIIFGIIPLIIWVLLPPKFSEAAGVVFSFAAWCLLLGVGDYLNVYNAITQMPKGSMTQLSGFHSYWYLP